MRRIRKYVPYLILLVAALDVILWFPSGAPIGWGDAGLTTYGANPTVLLHAASSPWNGLSQLGVRSAASMTLLPQAAYFDIARHLGLAPAFAEGLYFFAIQLTGMAAIYSISRRLGGNRVSAAGAVLAALFYNYVPLAFENYWMIGNSSVILIALAPLAVLVALRVPEKGVVQGSLELIAVEYFCFAAFQDPAYFLPVLFLTAGFGLFASTRGGGGGVKRLGMLCSVAIVGAAAAAWYALPDIFQLGSFFRQATAEANPGAYLAAADQNVNIHALLEFRAFRTGSPAFASYWAPSWRLTYSDPSFELIGLLLLAIVIAAAVVGVSRRDWRVTALVIASIVGLCLCLGGNPPFGTVYVWLFKHIPYFAAFRDPTNKWTPWLLVPSALLFAYGSSWLLGWTRRAESLWGGRGRSGPILHGLLAAVLALVVIGYGFPMFAGGPGDPQISSQAFVLRRGIRVPQSFAQVRDFLERQPGWFRVLVVPLSLNGYRWFRWPQGEDGPDLSWLQFGVPSLSSPYSQPISDGGRFLFSMASLSPSRAIEQAERLGCRYVLAEADAVGVGLSYFTPAHPSAAEFVAAAKRLGGEVVVRRGPLTLLSMPKASVAPLLSATAVTGGRAPSWVRLISLAKYSSAGARAVLTLYRGLDLVTFREAYDNQWHLDLTPVGRSGAAVVVERHTVVDGYANAWLVRVTGRTSEARVTAVLVYSGTQLEELGALLSAVTIAGLLFFGLGKRIRRKTAEQAGAVRART